MIAAANVPLEEINPQVRADHKRPEQQSLWVEEDCV